MWNVYLNIFVPLAFIMCFSEQTDNKRNRRVDIFSSVDNCTTPKCNDTTNKHDIKNSNVMENIDCHDTCKNEDITNQNDNNCFCDDLCNYYGDCCENAAVQKWQPSNDRNYLTMVNVTHYTCKEFSKLGVPLIDSCATDWRSDDISSQCETDIAEKQDVFLNTPVTNTDKNITYKNIYCAVCNNENDKQLKAWTLRMTCANVDSNLSNMILRDLRYNPDNGLWHCEVPDNVKTESKKNITCKHSIIPGDIVIDHIRQCKPHIATCLDNWQDFEISNLCQNFTAYRYDMQKIRYKNKYCAICNGVNVNDLECKIPKVLFRIGLNDLSLSILMDIDFNDGGQKVGKKDKCEPGEIFDSATGDCRKVSCDRFARMVDGKCKPLD